MTNGLGYTPSAIDEPVEAVINTIFDAARRGRLVICAGAGLSRALPSDLPSGQTLGNMLNERLEDLIAGYVPPPNPENLIAVADAGATLEGGKTALRTEVLRLAPFLTAEPNYGHTALAELLCEGGVEVLLLWNWDDCVERVDVAPERLQTARSKRDLEDLEQPSIAKVHGCATRRSTLLVDSDDLAEPPYWIDEAFRERLRGKTMVFIGVGDIADYAERRLEELRDELAQHAELSGQPVDVWIVSPRIRSAWDESQWARLLPDLPEERRIALSADEFLDQLARRWIREVLDELHASAADAVTAEIARSLAVVRAKVGAIGAARVLRWSRRAALGQEVGISVISCASFKQLLVGVAVILSEAVDDDVVIRGPAAVEISGKRIEALVVCNAAPSDRVRQRARLRAVELANHGTIGQTATFLVSGVVWGSLIDDPDTELDMTVGATHPEDVVVGASAVRLSFEVARTA